MSDNPTMQEYPSGVTHPPVANLWLGSRSMSKILGVALVGDTDPQLPMSLALPPKFTTRVWLIRCECVS